MNVKWYYRQSEVPDSVYQHLVQDRNNENGESVYCDTRISPSHTHTRARTCTSVLQMCEGYRKELWVAFQTESMA